MQFSAIAGQNFFLVGAGAYPSSGVYSQRILSTVIQREKIKYFKMNKSANESEFAI